MKKELLLILPIIFIVLSSGCVDDISEMFFPRGDKQATDVIILKDLKTLPSEVLPGQDIKIQAVIENIGDETVPQTTLNNYADQKLEVILYDYCNGLFHYKGKDGISCPIGATVTDYGCEMENFVPGEAVIQWTLKADEEINLETFCNFKVLVRYPYTTKTLTDIHFIDYYEMQRLVDQGKRPTKTSSPRATYGPIRIYVTSKDDQPIPVKNGVKETMTLELEILNEGSGFLASEHEINNEETISISKDDINIEVIGQDSNNIADNLEDCINEWQNPSKTETRPIKLVDGEAKRICQVYTPYSENIANEVPKEITGMIEYIYEFRESVEGSIRQS